MTAKAIGQIRQTLKPRASFDGQPARACFYGLTFLAVLRGEGSESRKYLREALHPALHRAVG